MNVTMTVWDPSLDWIFGVWGGWFTWDGYSKYIKNQKNNRYVRDTKDNVLCVLKERNLVYL